MDAKVWMLVGALAFAAPVFGAGEKTDSRVNGAGVVKIEVVPNVMRMHVQIESKSDTLDKAIADIQKQTDDLKAKLAGLNPVGGKVTVDGPFISGGGSSEQERMAAMMQRRFGGDAAKVKTDKTEIVLNSSVQAEWALAGADQVALLKESQKIREAVAALMPKKQDEEKKDGMTEEEEEAALMQQGGNENGPKPNEPAFVFVGKADKDQLSTARKEAFQKAKLSAQTTADAAGGKLGALVSLSSNVFASTGDDDGGMSFYMAQQLQRSMGFMGGNANDPDDAAGVSFSLKKVSLNVSVVAEFNLSLP